MDKTRLWAIGAAVVMVAIVALGWVVAIQPQLDAASAADAQTSKVEQTNTASSLALAQLQKDYKNLPALKSKLAALQTSVPKEQSIPSFVDELYALASANGLTITNWTATDGQTYAPPVAAAAPTASPSPSPSASAAPTPAPSPAPTAGVPPVTSPLITDTNFAAVPVTVSVTGPYANVLAFLHGTQTGQRLFLVSAFTSAPSAAGTGVDATVGGLIYVLTPQESANATTTETTTVKK
jgi:Tfp pilus assembly protein PilO